MTAGFSPAVHFQHSPLQPLAKLVNSPANSRYLSDSRQSHRISKSKPSRGQICKQRPFSEAGLRQQRPCTCTTASGSASLNPEEPQAGRADPPDATAPPAPPKPTGLFGHVKRFFFGDKLDKDRLKQLGMGAVASYGCVSNVTYGGGMAVAWIGFVRQFHKSPLMPGQWQAFLAFYAGFWTLQNFVRPLRFSLALAMAPVFDNFINLLASRLHMSKRNAFGVYLFILGTITSVLIFGSIRIFAGPLAYART